jgi:P-type conjugative transfer protein TrbJ
MTMKKNLVAALLGCAAVGSVGAGMMAATPAQAIPVFDASNYAQNLLIAARTLQQVNQQIQQLQNEATMLTDMAKHLSRIDFPQLQQLQQKLQQIDKLMGQAQGLDFRVDQLDERFRQLFPQEFAQAWNGDKRVADARARLEAATSQFRQTMGVQSQIVENVRDDAETLREIVSQSQGAEGSLQAQQATNQLLALAAKQQFQLQQLMAAQFRGEAIDQARRAQSEREGREMTRRFLGDGKAYTPR